MDTSSFEWRKQQQDNQALTDFFKLESLKNVGYPIAQTPVIGAFEELSSSNPAAHQSIPKGGPVTKSELHESIKSILNDLEELQKEIGCPTSPIPEEIIRLNMHSPILTRNEIAGCQYRVIFRMVELSNFLGLDFTPGASEVFTTLGLSQSTLSMFEIDAEAKYLGLWATAKRQGRLE